MIGFIACCVLAMFASAVAGSALVERSDEVAGLCGVITIACFVGAYFSLQ